MKQSLKVIAVGIAGALFMSGCGQSGSADSSDTSSGMTETAAGEERTEAGTAASEDTGAEEAAGGNSEDREAEAASDGTYTATSRGFGGDVTVAVAVEDGVITSAAATGDQETESVGGQAIKAFNDGSLGDLTGKSADDALTIDAYTGATLTSTALKNDLADIESQLHGSDKDASSEKTAMKAGTYTETVYGNNYSVPFTVDVTVSEDTIEKIEVTDTGGETEDIINTAIEHMIPDIIGNQSLAVDAVTGATASSGGIRTAVANAIDEAGGRSSEWYTAVEKKTDTVILDDYDVIVVGLGASGMSAYCSAAQTGAKVIAVESAAKVGGTSTNAGGPAAINPSSAEVQPAEGTAGYPVDTKKLKENWLSDTNGKAKEEDIDLMIDESGDTLDWMISDNGFDFTQLSTFMNYDYVIYASYDGDATGRTNTQMYQDALDSASGYNEKDQILLETKAEEILTDDDGTVCGIKAVSSDGTTYEIYAPAVILCTGGFGGSSEMTKEYLGSSMRLLGMYQNDGTMLSYAIDNLDAGTWNIASPGMAHSARTTSDLRSTDVKPSHQKILDAIVTATNVLDVDMDGKRFTKGDNGSEITENAYKAGDHYYAIVSEKYLEDIRENGIDDVYLMLNMQDGSMSMQEIMMEMMASQGEGNAQGTPAEGAPEGAAPQGAAPQGAAPQGAAPQGAAPQGAVPSDAEESAAGEVQGTVNKLSSYALHADDPIDDMDTILSLGEKMGIVVEADSIEELGEKIGAADLADTVEKYNTYAEEGEDPEFGKSAENMISLDDGSEKYYAIAGSAYCYSTTGGLNVNDDIEVLDTDGEVIPGLYACGTDSLGVLLDEKTGYLDYGGIAHGWCFTSGRKAGANAAEYARSQKQ